MHFSMKFSFTLILIALSFLFASQCKIIAAAEHPPYQQRPHLEDKYSSDYSPNLEDDEKEIKSFALFAENYLSESDKRIPYSQSIISKEEYKYPPKEPFPMVLDEYEYDSEDSEDFE